MTTHQYIINLDELGLESKTEYLEAILNTILFQRVYGIIEPITVRTDIDTYYSSIEDSTLKLQVEEIINEALKLLKLHQQKHERIMISLSFYEKKVRKAWFSTTEEQICWEAWYIILNGNSTLPLPSNHGNQLNEILMGIIDCIDLSKLHLPPITNKERFVFPLKFYTKVISLNELRMLDAETLSSKPLLT